MASKAFRISDYSAYADAFAAAAAVGGVIFLDDDVALTADLDIPSVISMLRYDGGKLMGDFNVTFNGNALDAPPVQVFALTGTGVVLAQSGANTMLGNWTGSTANVVANSMPSCPDSGSNHLNYVSGTGVTCGTAAPAFSAAPGTIVAAGTTDLSTVSNTVLSVTGNTTITSFGAGTNLYKIVNFTGTPLLTYNGTSLITPSGANIQAAPGDQAVLTSNGSGNWTVVSYVPFGGVKSATATGVSAPGGSSTNVTSLSLTPGKWMLSGGWVSDSNATTSTWIRADIVSTSATANGTLGDNAWYGAYDVVGGAGGVAIPPFPIVLTTTTTWYLVATPRSGDTFSAAGNIRAVRAY